MSLTHYYALLAMSSITLVLLIGSPLVKFMRLLSEGERESEAAWKRIAARQAAQTSLPAVAGDEDNTQEDM